MKQLTIPQICRISLLTALTVIMSQISIPMPYGVPMTMQTFIIPLVAFLSGKKEGTLVAMLYLCLGFIGLPIFAGFSGGLGVIIGPTGGFILSFPLMAYVSGMAQRKTKISQVIGYLSLAMLVNFIIGMIYFSFVTSSSWFFSFNACVLPFIPTSLVKIFLIFMVGKKITPFVYKQSKI